MAQLFARSADTYVRVGLAGALVALVGASLVISRACEPNYITAVNWAPHQPVPFSHAHHVGALGIDCRYCHNDVSRSSNAGFPPTHTCMSCHSRVWTNAELLAPVRQSYETGRPIRWKRVYDLPEFVNFKHNAHIHAGVGCESCHGRIDQQALTRQATSLQMEWCLDCHRHPADHIRPRNQVYAMGWQPPKNRRAMGRKLVKKYNIPSDILTDCSTCHY